MSTIKELKVTVKCDKCGTHREGSSRKAIRSAAKAAGWRLGKDKDFCPDCDAELQKKAKQVLAGG